MLPRPVRVAVGLAVALATARSTGHADPAPAPAPDPVPVALDEATFLARVRQAPRQRALVARAEAARTGIGLAATRPNPTLGYEREAVPSLDSADDFVRLGYPLDVAGRRGLATDAARAQADADGLEVARDASVLQVDARLAYLDAVYARELSARLDDARLALATLVDALRSRAKQGDASSYDADRAALELDRLDDDRASARRRLVAAQLRLGGLVGEPATAYAARDPLALPARPAAGSAPVRPDVDAALARARRATHEIRAARRSWIPRLELSAGMLASRSSSGEGVGYVVGIGGELPVFDRGTAAAARARAEAKRWRDEAAALANDARAETVQARRELTLRIEQAETYLAGPAPRATDLARRAAVAYREGDRPILELLDVQRGAREAALRAIELVYDARRAELALRKADGSAR